MRRTLARCVLDRFALHGFALVTPPVFEFAEVLERGLGTLDPDRRAPLRRAGVGRGRGAAAGHDAADCPDDRHASSRSAAALSSRLRGDRPAAAQRPSAKAPADPAGRASSSRASPGPEGDLELIALARRRACARPGSSASRSTSATPASCARCSRTCRADEARALSEAISHEGRRGDCAGVRGGGSVACRRAPGAALAPRRSRRAGRGGRAGSRRRRRPPRPGASSRSSTPPSRAASAIT